MKFKFSWVQDIDDATLLAYVNKDRKRLGYPEYATYAEVPIIELYDAIDIYYLNDILNNLLIEEICTETVIEEICTEIVDE